MPPRPLRVAALVKQIPEFEAMELGPDGRLRREGLPLEMNAYCRRAVAKGVELARSTGGTCTVFTLGPPSAEDVLREAIACGADRGILVSDPAFAGSDTLATARALASAIAGEGGFDLVLTGRSSADSDTGQVGPELAELLDLPFVTGVKRLLLTEDGRSLDVGLELDDAWVEATVALPAVASAAERLVDPCKIKDPAVWATVPATSITHLRAEDLAGGPWGLEGSPTRVGATRREVVDRAGRILEGPIEDQLDELVVFLDDRRLLDPADDHVGPAGTVLRTGGGGPPVAAVLEPGRARLARELLGEAAALAHATGGRTVALAVERVDERALSAWGADEVLHVTGVSVEEDLAPVVADWCGRHRPWAVITGSTAWGREVASRVAAALGAGLTGDAVGLAVEGGRLVAWKPAFGGEVVAAITSSSPVQLVTVRPGILTLRAPRVAVEPQVATVEAHPRGRVVVRRRRQEDDLEALATADAVIGVGRGVPPDDYHLLAPLRKRLDAELAATRKVTDEGWMPHARQVGITGQAIAPRLYLALGTSGKYNHMVGVRSAGTVVAVNPDRDAPIWRFADIGIAGDWRDVVDGLERRLGARGTTGR